jgi:hemolysin activation/secretion protein
LEFRVPVFTTADGVDRLNLAPYADIGRSWNTGVPDETARTMLASAGIGLIATITQQSRFEIYWGHQLNHLQLGRGNLQDHGVHLQLVIQAF